MITDVSNDKSLLPELFDNARSIAHFVKHPVPDQLDCGGFRILSAKDPKHIKLLGSNSLLSEYLRVQRRKPSICVKDIYCKLMTFIPEFSLFNLFF
jgi:hypothetical protein